MSEVEFNTMSRAATSLDRGMSEKDFIEELDEITNAMNVVLSRNNQSITGTPTPPPAGGSG